MPREGLTPPPVLLGRAGELPSTPGEATGVVGVLNVGERGDAAVSGLAGRAVGDTFASWNLAKSLRMASQFICTQPALNSPKTPNPKLLLSIVR